MRYVSTRGKAEELTFPDVMTVGLASDGGLYVPTEWPSVPELAPGVSYPEIVAGMVGPYVGGAVSSDVLYDLADAAYASFPQPDVVPLRPIDERTHILELFWGPTLAFKDLALQMVARLFGRAPSGDGPTVVVGATSGDTGAATIEAFRGRKSTAVVVLYPIGRISEFQRRQMTTVGDRNVHNVGVEGTFDDCQRLVKQLLVDQDLQDEVQLASANSINWLRIAAQTVYYAAACTRVGDAGEPISFSIPSGNFGNAYSCFVARLMGLPIDRIVVATNRNSGLAELIESGRMDVEPVEPTLSPAMDIRVPSNLERLLYELTEGDAQEVTEAMGGLSDDGTLTLGEGARHRLRAVFDGESVSEEETLAGMADHHRATGNLIDPHTAVALVAARRAQKHIGPIVVVGTAHPAKFPEAVERATGALPALPERFAYLLQRPETYETVPNQYPAVRDIVLAAGGRSETAR